MFANDVSHMRLISKICQKKDVSYVFMTRGRLVLGARLSGKGGPHPPTQTVNQGHCLP